MYIQVDKKGKKLSLKLNAQIRDRMVQLGEFGHVSVTFSKM